jgi:hypothetical protein
MSDQNQFGDFWAPVFKDPRSSWALVCSAPPSPTVNRLKFLLNHLDRTNIRASLAEADQLVDRADPHQHAFLVEIGERFAVWLPGEPLPLSFE